MLDQGAGRQQDHSVFLSALARADDAALKAEAERLLPDLGAVEVLVSRTGLVMLPLRDTVKGTDFFLGEVLVAEAHIRVGAVQGYGLRRGRDLEAAMAMAVLDAARALGLAPARSFAAEQARAQAKADHALLCRVEATRVDMETF